MTTSPPSTTFPDRSTRPRPGRSEQAVRPTRRDEAWRYAPHDLLGQLSFGPPSASARSIPAVLDGRIPALDGPRMVTVNGVVDHAGPDVAGLPEGLRLSALADAGADRDDPASHVDADPGTVGDGFLALNRTFGVDGPLVEVAEGHRIVEPIHLVDLVIPEGAPNTSCRTAVIHIGRGASATIVETRVGLGEASGGSNTRTTIVLEVDATLDHILIQDVPATQVHLGRVDVTQRAGSTLRARSFNLGAVYGRLAYDVLLAGAGANADLSGLYVGSGAQTLDQQITVVHAARDCTSRQAFRGVLDERSTGVFNGGIDVRPGADGTDARQTNDNLLLSTGAEANTQPRLEILADDVVCSHGATVGQLDDDALYYLRTRGISATDARRLLVDAFTDRSVDDVGIAAVRSWLRARLGAHDG